MSSNLPPHASPRFPALGIFKNEEFVHFEGDLTQEVAVLRSDKLVFEGACLSVLQVADLQGNFGVAGED